MQQRTRCSGWLEPVDILEIAESDIGCPATVPLMVDPNEAFVDVHGPLPWPLLVE